MRRSCSLARRLRALSAQFGTDNHGSDFLRFFCAAMVLVPKCKYALVLSTAREGVEGLAKDVLSR